MEKPKFFGRHLFMVGFECECPSPTGPIIQGGCQSVISWSEATARDAALTFFSKNFPVEDGWEILWMNVLPIADQDILDLAEAIKAERATGSP